MGRKPVHLLAAGGKPYGRQAMWQAMRKLKRFTLSDVAATSDCKRDSVRTYLHSLVRSGHIRAVGNIPARRSAFLTKPAPENRATLYELVKDQGVEAPRVMRDGSPSTQGAAREQMWRTMRILCEFTPRELAFGAGTEGSPVAESDAGDYARDLERAGYLVRIEKASKLSQARYRFVPARWSGPKAPMVQRLKSIFDPNLNRVVWRDEKVPE